ncbi:hypothetical protein HPMG_00451 [Helicobacter pullorum MIT 98-5489]|uniref:Uncharacterized protein n=1 Tax=Helicobacter pullorum MIT 98-5489 TaxID=537972 RepID=C5EXI3_9HELI|nr:hypothetical protein HPMG_00451 [Helicobacter pullorum MIT 98-5489]
MGQFRNLYCNEITLLICFFGDIAIKFIFANTILRRIHHAKIQICYRRGNDLRN